MKDFFLLLQIVIAGLLVFIITIQVKSGGLGRNFTAGSFTRRGLEKLIFKGTFVLLFLFVLVSILQIIA